MVVEDNEHDTLRDRLHAARRSLGEAYDKRDTLAANMAAAEKNTGTLFGPGLLMALTAAEHAVLAAEVEMKDAEHALAVATQSPIR